MKTICVLAPLLLSSLPESGEALAFQKADTPSSGASRRSFLEKNAAVVATGAVLLSMPSSASAADQSTPVGREINSFVDLIYNFKNTALNGGLDASALNEPSIPFLEFGEKMKNGEVTFVEFIAPDGKVAYATIKDKKKKYKQIAKYERDGTVRLRIGQGYPTGGKDSWSSPDYVIRSVSNFGVPYKFTVPALEKAKYKKY